MPLFHLATVKCTVGKPLPFPHHSRSPPSYFGISLGGSPLVPDILRGSRDALAGLVQTFGQQCLLLLSLPFPCFRWWWTRARPHSFRRQCPWRVSPQKRIVSSSRFASAPPQAPLFVFFFFGPVRFSAFLRTSLAWSSRPFFTLLDSFHTRGPYWFMALSSAPGRASQRSVPPPLALPALLPLFPHPLFLVFPPSLTFWLDFFPRTRLLLVFGDVGFFRSCGGNESCWVPTYWAGGCFPPGGPSIFQGPKSVYFVGFITPRRSHGPCDLPRLSLPCGRPLPWMFSTGLGISIRF